MKLVWTEAAISDRCAIYEYIEVDNPRAAVTLDNLLEKSASQLLTYSKIGRPGRVSGTRELVVSGTPYVMVYRIVPTTVFLLRVLHGAQRWPPL